MRPNRLRASIAAGRPVIGPILQEIPDSPDLVEFFGSAGFDFVVIDAEHGGVDVGTARDLARAADAVGMTPLARVPSVDYGRILALLDSGIQGIVLAHCNTVDEAESLVRATKYPPRGVRGAASGSRAAGYGYGPDAREKIEIADAETMCFGLIEEPRALDAVVGMLAVDGFDGCFLGAGDMSLAMGREFYGGAETHPDVAAAMDRVRQQTLAAGKLVMEPAGSGAAARALIDKGVQLVVLQFGQFLRAAADAYLRTARGD
ncbi:MAG TPA: aldolase/citrate lyase family protein [Candidatus Limnocylindria bacterium]